MRKPGLLIFLFVLLLLFFGIMMRFLAARREPARAKLVKQTIPVREPERTVLS